MVNHSGAIAQLAVEYRVAVRAIKKLCSSHSFNNLIVNHIRGAIAQLARASAWHAEGQGFESL